MDKKFSCPRCKYYLSSEKAQEHAGELIIISCPNCQFDFRLSAFKKQSERALQNCEWPNDPEKQRLLSDNPSDRTKVKSAQVSIMERIQLKLGNEKTKAILALRSGMHQLLIQCVNLCDLYPAIPYNLKTAKNLEAFWLNPEDKFVLDSIFRWMSDVDEIAKVSFDNGFITRGDIRKVIDDELPHASWNGVTTTYSIMRPEFRGLLLSIMLLEAKKCDIPNLIKQVKLWLREDGWDEYGYALEINKGDGSSSS